MDLLTETIARHFPEARVADGEIELGFAGLRMRCEVNQVVPAGRYHSAALFFQLSGGELGPAPIFASISGYGDTPEEAVALGACNWACAFGPVLRAALADEGEPAFEVTLHGQRFRGYVDAIDRWIAFEQQDIGDRARVARQRFGASPWLTPRALEAAELPLLPVDRPSIVSVFVGDYPGQRTVELKLNGRDWPGAERAFEQVPDEPEGGMALLRELAVLVPGFDVAPLSRAAIEATLRGLAADDKLRRCVAWPGWRAHGGELAPPAAEEEVARLEKRVGPLPADYRAFLTTVALKGAGPGYGLLSPFGAAQLDLAATGRGALALASSGCGAMWLLFLRGAERGEVWVDASGVDGTTRRVASSFSEWYRAWLDAAVRDVAPFCHWDEWACATVKILAQLLERAKQEGLDDVAARAELPSMLTPGAIRTRSGGTPYFGKDAPLDVCESCAWHLTDLGLAHDVVAPGVRPRQADETPPPEGLFARVARALRGSDKR